MCLLFTVIQNQLLLLGSGGSFYLAVASGIGFRSIFNRFKTENIYCTRIHKHSVPACLSCSGCAQLLRPTEWDIFLDARKSQTEKDNCHSEWYFPNATDEVLSHSLSLSLSLSRSCTHTYSGRAQVRNLCVFECQCFNGVLILYKTGSSKQIPQHVAACWSASLSFSLSFRVCLCDLWRNEVSQQSGNWNSSSV